MYCTPAFGPASNLFHQDTDRFRLNAKTMESPQGVLRKTMIGLGFPWKQYRPFFFGRHLLLSCFLLVAVIESMVFGVQSTQEPSLTPDAVEFFEQKIRPLLIDRCIKCHGDAKQWANLRLDSRHAMLAGGDSGPAIDIANPDQSALLVRVLESDSETRMPPAESGPSLNPEQIGLLQHWIAMGAPWPATVEPSQGNRKDLWEKHWAFQPVRSQIPDLAESVTADFALWQQSPIDRFVFNKLWEHQLTPSPQADPSDLVRRVTYTLTGLPPTSESIASFKQNPSSEAYAALVDRLLDSPEYGEHWGRHWLDVARYSDTKGYVYGREEKRFVHATHYRDWVIEAFNRDLPYDRFVLLQLAADQAPDLDRRDLAAMGFLTLGRRFLGIAPDIIDDRIDVVSRGLLGLTVGCARCHDHKYDPVPTADYYSLYGVFENSIDELTAIPPTSTGPSSHNQTDATYETELAERKRKLSAALVEKRLEANERLRNRLGEYLMAQKKLDLYPEMTFNQIVPKEDLIPTLVRRWQAYLIQAEHESHPVFSAWIAYASIPDGAFETEAPKRHDQLSGSNSFWNPLVRDAFRHPPKSLQEVANRYQALVSEIDKRWAIDCERARQLNRPLPSQFDDPDLEQLRQAFHGVDSSCVMPEGSLLNHEWYWDTATGDELWKLSNAIDQWLLQSPHSIAGAPHVVALTDRHQRQEPQIFKRGNPANKGAVVSRHMLSLGKPVAANFQVGSGRMELAKSIVSPENPLTARVWVNRVWAHHFGAGLVTTPSDFGTRANAPSHPELLDWLSQKLVDLKWSTKALHREILLSQTYMQASRVPSSSASPMAKAMEIDPENRLLWRMNPRKLSIEQYRDTLLTVSGQLDKTRGGLGGELFGKRRSIYLSIDRQFLPNVFSVFDMANPDLHSSQRTETTIPQQALFSMNHPFVIERAKDIAVMITNQAPKSERAKLVFEAILGRTPLPDELQAMDLFLTQAESLESKEADADIAEPFRANWTYGYGKIDPATGVLESFQKLPHFTGTSWQGGISVPDPSHGWVYLEANGGHPGNDHDHAVVRRWTAPQPGFVSVASELIHRHEVGDGVAAWIASSRSGVLKSAKVHHRTESMSVDSFAIQAGDTLDFIVDIAEQLNTDQFEWAAVIQWKPQSSAQAPSPEIGGVTWDSRRDFTKTMSLSLKPLEQLAHSLLMSNEFIFVD